MQLNGLLVRMAMPNAGFTLKDSQLSKWELHFLMAFSTSSTSEIIKRG